MLVSVVMSTYDSLAYLPEALDAIAAQTLAPEELEIVVVDDGSTDDTWSYLTARSAADPRLRIFHQPNSGGASRGRNRGLDEARGRYVFFHDADDHLGVDALRRLVETAEAESSDVVVGRHRHVGRPTAHRPTDVTNLDADLIEDGVWRSLAPHKLFRRTLLDRLGVRFPEDQRYGEDQVFVAACLFAATKVSILGGYDFYLRRNREDGGNLSGGHQSLTNKGLTSARMTALVVANTEPGRRRDTLLRRVVHSTLAGGLHSIFAAASPTERADFLAAMRTEVFPSVSDRLLELAPYPVRVRLLAARDGTADQLVALVRMPQPPQPALVAAEPTATGLDLVLRIETGPLPVDRVELEGRVAGGRWIPLASASAAEQTRLRLEPPDAAEEQRHALRVRLLAGRIEVVEAPLTWPADDPPATKAVVRAGGRRRVLKLYPGTDGRARLVTR